MHTYSNLNPSPKGGAILILICRIDLEELKDSGKEFPWINPDSCPCCGGYRLWGHGFVLRYFHGYTAGLWLKRYRCPDCHTVHTLRPEKYSLGFQYPWKEIQSSLEQKLKGLTFRIELSRQCQQYWMKALLFQQKRVSNWPGPIEFPLNQKQVTFRLNYREIPYRVAPPYLPFAVTVRPLRI